jgi:hypothetical protein
VSPLVVFLSWPSFSPHFEPSRRETLAPVKSPAEAAACPLSLLARPVLA